MKAILFVALLAAAPAAAQTAPAPAPAPAAAPAAKPNILDRAINIPGTNWSVYGAKQTAKMLKVDGVPGNQAMHVEVTEKGANPWDAGASSPIQRPIAANDVILVAAYMRAPKLKDGETAPIAFLGATEAKAPYTGIGGAPVAIGNAWKLYYGAGKSPQAFAPGTATVSVQLAAAKQAIELGPVFVLDFGPNQDIAKLPHN